jgi:hypothetical protein
MKVFSNDMDALDMLDLVGAVGPKDAKPASAFVRAGALGITRLPWTVAARERCEGPGNKILLDEPLSPRQLAQPLLDEL